MRLSAVLIAGLAALPLLAAPRSAVAQSGFHPRWEIPGFDFRENGAWRVRAQRVADRRRQLIAQARVSALSPGVPALSGASVTGTMLVPALLFSYQDTDSTLFMRDTAQYSSVLFGAVPPGGNPYTLRTFYEQMSRGSFSLGGKIIGWVRLDSAEVKYTGTPPCSGNPFPGSTNCNGLFDYSGVQTGPNPTARMQNGFRQALSRVDGAVNFAQFDNDGPDLIPNSGDDDGFVDMIMFAHATKDGACGGTANNHVWSHRFVLVNASGLGYQDYVTNDVSAKAGFGNIRISDYFATTALGGASACDTTQIMPIGTAAHEFGHALGLPDLYDTSPLATTEGIGQWGLMGSGNFTSPASPSRMEAWSLNELGWVTVRALTTAGTYSFGAAPVSDTAFLVNVQGTNTRNEYFLLENRQASQADTALIRIHCARSGNPPGCSGGLLIWHIDPTQILGHGFHQDNAVNVGPIHGVALMQADGLNQLNTTQNRGDAGDAYPGTSGNTAFSYGTTPAAVKNVDGSGAGITVDSIRQMVPGGAMAFRLRFGVNYAGTFFNAADVVAQLLGPTAPLTSAQLQSLDTSGNNNGSFDVGDFLAFVKATGAAGAAAAAALSAAARRP